MTEQPSASSGEHGGIASSEPDDGTQASDLDDAALLQRIKRRFREARSASGDWRKEAREDYDFYSGQQWSTEDVDTLKAQMRPVITFNRVAPTVDTVGGMEVNNRQEIRCYPRVASGGSPAPQGAPQQMPPAPPGGALSSGPNSMNGLQAAPMMPAPPPSTQASTQPPSESAQAECLSNAIKWVRDECDAEDEESDMFMDSVICGMGWTETRLDYEIDPDGVIVEERIDPLEMFWDPYARKRNLADARYVIHRKEIDITEARGMFPKAQVEDLHASWASPEEETSSGDVHDQTEARKYDNDQTSAVEGKRRKAVILHVQWIEKEVFYRTVDLKTGSKIKLSEDDFKIAKERVGKLLPGVELPGLRQYRKVIKQAFCGSKVLSVESAPCDDDFTFQAITGKRDRNKKQWYGIVRAMKDPQRWANKFFSTILHSIATSGKGIIAAQDAFVDWRKAEDNWSNPDSIAFSKPGIDPSTKIMPKPSGGLPQGLPDMLTFALSSMRDVTGVNLEMLGQADREQAASLEWQRRKSAFSILAGFFDGLRHYRKRQGRLLIHLIQEYISDGRLMRIETDNGEPAYVPLNRDETVAEYDLIVDDAPSSPDQKEATWNILGGMLPMIAGKLPIPPEMWGEIIKQSPLPDSFANKLVQILQKQASQPQAPDPKMQLIQAQIAALQAKTQMDQQAGQQKLQTDSAEHQMDMQQTQEKGRVELMVQQAQAQQEAETEQARLQHDIIATQVETQARMALETQESQNDMALQRMKTEEGLKLKRDEFEEKKRQGAYKAPSKPKTK